VTGPGPSDADSSVPDPSVPDPSGAGATAGPGSSGAGSPGAGEPAGNPLSTREREVLRASASEASIRELGRQLRLSSSTVRNYLALAIRKTGCDTRDEAYTTALANGWI
jgi:DNA-binding CsgD family transcriptional regulator